MSKKYTEAYTDGAVYPTSCWWAYIIVDGDEIEHQDCGDLNSGGAHFADVEAAELEALYQAVRWCSTHEGNYRIYTDSRSCLDKIQQKVPNATRNPHVNGIITMLEAAKLSPLPISIVISWKKRRSNKWMQLVDDYVEKPN